jgi:hypothetical protein
MSKWVYEYKRDSIIRNYATLVFMVSIALLGALMMTLTSSPLAKGAAFLWLPAALQLIAGIWLGPIKGAIASGIGAYSAGILAYGGWGIPDVIMNLVAGGFANGMLPSLLFRWLNVDPDFGGNSDGIGAAIGKLAIILFTIVLIAFALLMAGVGNWGYIPPILFLLIAPFYLRNSNIDVTGFIKAFLIIVLISGISALIGCYGSIIAGQTFKGALLGTGIGWFLGDTASCLLGLYMLSQFTQRAREKGLAPVIKK